MVFKAVRKKPLKPSCLCRQIRENTFRLSPAAPPQQELGQKSPSVVSLSANSSSQSCTARIIFTTSFDFLLNSSFPI